MIERMIRQLIEVEIPEIYIVVGHQKEAFSYLEEKYGVHLIENTEYAVRNQSFIHLCSTKGTEKFFISVRLTCTVWKIFLILMSMSLTTRVHFPQKRTAKLCVTTGF